MKRPRPSMDGIVTYIYLVGDRNIGADVTFYNYSNHG